MLKIIHLIQHREINMEWSVDISVTTVEGLVITKSAAPAIVTADLTMALPAPTGGGEAYSVSASTVSVEASVDMSVAFTQTFTSRVLETHTEQIISVISEQYTESKELKL